MAIVLLPVGSIDPLVLDLLNEELSEILQKPVRVGKGLDEVGYAYNPARNQFLSTAILKVLLEQNDLPGYERILGVVDHDLYVPELNFVFGEASPRAAVLSLPRLRETFYERPGNTGLFRKRVLTEAVHELGHTYGLGHCRKASCVMFFSNSLAGKTNPHRKPIRSKGSRRSLKPAGPNGPLGRSRGEFFLY